MRQRLMLGVVIVWALFVWSIAITSVFAESPSVAGARSAVAGDGGKSIRSQSAQSIPTFLREVTAAFTAPPTTGSLGEALEASRLSFSAAEAIEFNAVLLESGLTGTAVNLQLYLFDSKGRLVAGGFFVGGVMAPSDRTDFFIQIDAGSLAPGRFKWLMVIYDAFGNTFVTPFQGVDVQ
ncbi:hypothetical protein [Candidatus Methylomirabilis sp.]|uniref:hypothetical protein n=1 Tax=Candidatus Methylomirabilis sp. TaxID=2032687 RepID=UPI002A5C6AE0|nr:hypothetical protein [Candidatus Methylomirabilis sp.]